MAAFPNYTPTSRSFEPGVYPQRSYRTLSGINVKRTFGNQPFGAKLEMEFDNVGTTVIDAILNHYKTQTAANERFKVYTTTAPKPMAGVASTTRDYLLDTSTLRWEYASPPRVESVRNELYRISVSLVGEIKNRGLDD